MLWIWTDDCIKDMSILTLLSDIQPLCLFINSYCSAADCSVSFPTASLSFCSLITWFRPVLTNHSHTLSSLCFLFISLRTTLASRVIYELIVEHDVCYDIITILVYNATVWLD
jgi:hypothetical protein